MSQETQRKADQHSCLEEVEEITIKDELDSDEIEDFETSAVDDEPDIKNEVKSESIKIETEQDLEIDDKVSDDEPELKYEVKSESIEVETETEDPEVVKEIVKSSKESIGSEILKNRLLRRCTEETGVLLSDSDSVKIIDGEVEGNVNDDEVVSKQKFKVNMSAIESLSKENQAAELHHLEGLSVYDQSTLEAGILQQVDRALEQEAAARPVEPTERMPKTHKPAKAVRRTYPQEVILEAIQAVKGGLTVTAAAKNFGIPRQTLKDKLSGKYAVGCAMGRPPVLNRANPNVQDRHKATPLHISVIAQNLEITKLLLEQGANPNIQDQRKETPLHISVVAQNFEITKLLLEQGANPNIQDQHKETPLHISVIKDNVLIIQILLACTDLTICNSHGNTPIHRMIELNCKHKYIPMTLPYLSDVNLKNDSSNSLLYHAVRYDYSSIVQLLLEKGADINIANNDGNTALLSAAQGGQVEVVQLLLAKGADIHIANNDGNTALLSAAQGGQVEIVQLLLAKGADINRANNYGDTALLSAAQGGHVEIVQLLLAEKGVDINRANNYGNTALLSAAQGGHDEIVKQIIRAQDGVLDYSTIDVEKKIIYYYNHSSEMKRFLREWGSKEIIYNESNVENSILNNPQSAHYSSVETKAQLILDKLVHEYGVNQHINIAQHIDEITKYIQLLESDQEVRNKGITFSGQNVKVVTNNNSSKVIEIKSALNLALKLLESLVENDQNTTFDMLKTLSLVWIKIEDNRRAGNTDCRSDLVKTLIECAVEYSCDSKTATFQPSCMSGIFTRIMSVIEPFNISDILTSAPNTSADNKPKLVSEMLYTILENMIQQDQKINTLVKRIEDDKKYQDDDRKLRQEVNCAIYKLYDQSNIKIDIDSMFAFVETLWDNIIKYYTIPELKQNLPDDIIKSCFQSFEAEGELLGQIHEDWDIEN